MAHRLNLGIDNASPRRKKIDMKLQHGTPSDIENASMQIIAQELAASSIRIHKENAAVVRRVIHATADFDYAFNLRFSDGAVLCGMKALMAHTPIITDTNMALAGISKPALGKLRCEAHCFMADSDIAASARANGTTRAAAAMEYAAANYPGAIYSIGNAPTALFKLADQIGAGLRPALVIAVPVGFVNVVEGKERIWRVCLSCGVPIIAAMGRKGGSTVAAAIANALLYAASEMQDPAARGWN